MWLESLGRGRKEEKAEVGEERRREEKELCWAGSSKKPAFPLAAPLESAASEPSNLDQEWQPAKDFIVIVESMG